MAIQAIDIRKVRIKDEFWQRETELVRKEVIPYQWEILNDRVSEAEPSFCMHNFRAAGAVSGKMKKLGAEYEGPKYTFRGFAVFPEKREEAKEDEFYGFVFQDSDFAKWIEAVAYSLMTHPDSMLEETADKAIDIVCAAQLPNGYLDTYYIINGMDQSFTNLRDHHELYCMGHLIEGAIAYYQATGKDKLLQAAKRFADYAATVFGPEEGKNHGYPGHEIAEMALFRLYELTGEERYKELAEYFIDQRGREPFYFEKEHPEMKRESERYHQSHIPVREQKEAVGHAVRAVYLYSGMADMARLTGDQELLAACERLWDSIVNTKLYITGGIGGTHIGEAFSFPYDLPNDTAYAETCASIGLVFFARRMLCIKPDRKYSDVMELALYNNILSGMALDGKSFFYVNPLEVLPEACRRDERKAHVKPVRQKWFGCACCPPNIARLVTSVASYAFTESENTLYTHIYLGCETKKSIGGKEVVVRMDSGLPIDGKVQVTVENAEDTEFCLALRIPGWTKENYRLLLPEGVEQRFSDGYVYLSHFGPKAKLCLELDLTPRVLAADERVNELEGQAAVLRGPVVYCAEEKDNGPGLGQLCLKRPFRIRETISEDFGFPAVFLKADAERRSFTGRGEFESGLYHRLDEEKDEDVELTMIPYSMWANRGEGEMRVYLKV